VTAGVPQGKTIINMSQTFIISADLQNFYQEARAQRWLLQQLESLLLLLLLLLLLRLLSMWLLLLLLSWMVLCDGLC
jgi:hypothetical protein